MKRFDISKIIFTFAVRHFILCTAKSQQFFETTYIGVVSLDSFCSAIGECRNLERATPLFVNFYFLRMRHSVKNNQGAKRSNFLVTLERNEMRLQQQLFNSTIELISKFSENGECLEAIKSVNFLLNQFVSSNEFETFNKTFRKNLVFDATRTMVFLAAISEQSNQIKILRERSMSC